MYDNIGEKIKGLATAIFIIEALPSVIAGLILLFSPFALIGVLVLVLGPLVAWISSWLLYGFGELIATNQTIAKNTEILVARNRNSGGAPRADKQFVACEISSFEKERSQYSCHEIFITDQTALVSYCNVCHLKNPPLHICEITTDVGKRKIPVCENCIRLFQKHSKSASLQGSEGFIAKTNQWTCRICGKTNALSSSICWNCETEYGA